MGTKGTEILPSHERSQGRTYKIAVPFLGTMFFPPAYIFLSFGVMARVNYICLHICLKLEHLLLSNSCMHYSDEKQMLEYGCYNICTMVSTCSYFTTSIIQFQDAILENIIPMCWLSLTLLRCYNLTDSAERNKSTGYSAIFGKFTNKGFY